MDAIVECSTASARTVRNIQTVGSDTVFHGEPVLSEIYFMHTGEAEKDPEIKALMRWAVCLHRDSDDPDGWVTAQVIGLPGVASEGATRDEALENVGEAFQCAMESLDADEELSLRREFRIPAGGEVVYLSL